MPDDLEFSVVLDDLTKDAAMWREIGAVLAEALSSARSVDYLPFMVTDGVAYAAGFRDQYNTLAQRTSDYLADGVATFEDLAYRLEATRAEYEGSEMDAAATVAHELRLRTFRGGRLL